MRIAVLLFSLGFASQAVAQANVRLVSVDPENNLVTIKNFGNVSQDISSWRLCSLISYTPSSGLGGFVQSGDLDLASGEEVVILIQSGQGGGLTDLDDAAADLGLYLQQPFSSAANMVDFTQWGSAGNGREGVAVSKGIWTAGDFVTEPSPYRYIGDGSQDGVAYWENSESTPEVPMGGGWLLLPGLMATGVWAAARLPKLSPATRS